MKAFTPHPPKPDRYERRWRDTYKERVERASNDAGMTYEERRQWNRYWGFERADINPDWSAKITPCLPREPRPRRRKKNVARHRAVLRRMATGRRK